MKVPPRVIVTNVVAVIIGVALILFLIFPKDLEVTPMVMGNRYRLHIKASHQYSQISAIFEGKYYEVNILELGDDFNYYEILFENLSPGTYSCKLFFEKLNGDQSEQLKTFKILGEEL